MLPISFNYPDCLLVEAAVTIVIRKGLYYFVLIFCRSMVPLEVVLLF